MKKQDFLGMTVVIMLIAAGCSNNNNQGTQDTTLTITDTTTFKRKTTAHADINATKSDTSGSGTADFDIMENGDIRLTLKLDFPVMANKNVAVHIHEHGDCGDAGNMTHGHWNPTEEAHGQWGGMNYHSGDIGNIMLDAKGKAEFIMETSRWTIGGDSITNVLYHAIIVHSGTDDYKSQPAGNAGSRIGCGVIK